LGLASLAGLMRVSPLCRLSDRLRIDTKGADGPDAADLLAGTSRTSGTDAWMAEAIARNQPAGCRSARAVASYC
jgi:hypothetical protein